MPREKKLIIPDQINIISADTVVNEVAKNSAYSKLIGWDLIISNPNWISKTEFTVEIHAKRCRVANVVMAEVEKPKIKPAKKKKKKRFIFSIDKAKT